MNFPSAQMASKTGFVKSTDQTPLFFRHYFTKESQGTIFVVHGFAEHSGRYTHVVERLIKENFEVFAVDLRGHGYSEGSREDIEDFRYYEDDMISGLTYALSHRTNCRKFFVIAHSMGALIALRVVTRRSLPLDGMVLSCPLINLAIPMPTWKKWMALSVATLLPKTKLKSNIKGCQLSSDQVMASAYDTDPLINKNLSARTFWQIFKNCQGLDTIARNINLAFFMQVGGKDSVVDVDATKRWFGYVNCRRVDATMKVYPKLLHEIYNELDRQLPIEDAVSWLKNRASFKN
jgi:lysophospholipase